MLLPLEMQKVNNVWVWKDEPQQHYTVYDEAGNFTDHQLDAMHYMFQGLRKGSYAYAGTPQGQGHSWIKDKFKLTD